MTFCQLFIKKQKYYNMSEVKSESEINIRVGLDEDKIPVRLTWKAPGNPGNEEDQECKAILLSLFDKNSKETLKIDLWTKDMQVVEMDRFIFQTLRALADTYYKATHNNELASAMQEFINYFGEKTEIIPNK